MSLRIGGRLPEFTTIQPTLIPNQPANRLARLPKGTIIPPGTTVESQAERCRDAATLVLFALTEIPPLLRRWQFLDQALAEHDEVSERRKNAVHRRNWYRAQVRGSLTEAILHESRGDAAWRYLEGAERLEFGVSGIWECEPSRESLIGLTFFSGHSWATQYLPADFDLRTTIGFVPNLKQLQPYRHDIAEYINRGWLDGDLGNEWAKAEQAAKRKSAIAGLTRTRLYNQKET